MSRAIFILVFCIVSTISWAQENYIGVRGGMNGGNMTILPSLPKKMNFGFYEGGISYKYVGGEKWVGGVQIEATYAQTGITLMPRPNSDSTYNRSFSTIEVPFMWHPSYGFANDKVRVFLNAGPYFSYIMDSKYEYIDKKDLSSDYNRGGDYVFNRFLDVRFGYGVMGGAGLEVMLTKRFQMQLEFRYKFSFSDIWKNKAKIDPSISKPTISEKEQMFDKEDYSQSQVNQMAVSFGLFYKFGRDMKKNRVK